MNSNRVVDSGGVSLEGGKAPWVRRLCLRMMTGARFASATGMSPIAYCRAVCIARAREFLEGGDTSQKGIAQSLDHKDVASFARAFRNAVGTTPGAYRRKFGRNGISPADVPARQKQHMFEAGLSRG